VLGWVVAGHAVSVLVSFTGVRDSASACDRWAAQRAKPSAAHRERCHAELTSERSQVQNRTHASVWVGPDDRGIELEIAGWPGLIPFAGLRRAAMRIPKRIVGVAPGLDEPTQFADARSVGRDQVARARIRLATTAAGRSPSRIV
jgi:hypothetical protein